MTYLYTCPNCKLETEITKPMAEVDRVEYCEICESELQTVWLDDADYDYPIEVVLSGTSK